jgi:hypothetical protein
MTARAALAAALLTVAVRPAPADPPADPAAGAPAGEPVAGASAVGLDGPLATGLVWPDYTAPQMFHTWARAEAVRWSLPDGPLRVPLVTTGDPTVDPLAGNLGQPTTRVLFGGAGLDYGPAAGFRVTAGGATAGFGGEVSVLRLDGREVAFGARSGPAGSPALYVPVFNLGTGREGSVIVADPVFGEAGAAAALSRSALWGWEANALVPVGCGWAEVALVGGIRYLELTESLALRTSATDLVFGTQTDGVDVFGTSSRFYGGQVGGRVTASHGPWFAGLTARVAVGATRSSADVAGQTVQVASPPTPSGTFPGGIFAQPTNLGRRSATDLAAVPELNLRIGWEAWGCLRVYVGYDMLYWTRVARPGDQIDRSLNLSQSPVFGAGSLTGSARPAGLLGRTDFFAHGLAAGLELRY